MGTALLERFSVEPGLVERAIALCPPDGRADLVALAACLGGDRATISARLDALAFPADERAIVATAARARRTSPTRSIPGDRGRSRSPPGDAELWRTLRRERPETVALAGALGPVETARRWLEDVRHRRLAINGDDIVAAGITGPAVGEALDAAMVAMLEGRAGSREAQLAAALA